MDTIALARAAFLTFLGLAFGLLGQRVGDFVRGYQVIVAYGLILLGVLGGSLLSLF